MRSNGASGIGYTLLKVLRTFLTFSFTGLDMRLLFTVKV